MTVVALSTMKKADIIEELRDSQAEGWSDKMSIIELRAILKEVRKMNNPEESELKGLTTKKLAELQGQYRRVTGKDPADMTRGLLMAAIRNHVMGTKPLPAAASDSSASSATKPAATAKTTEPTKEKPKAKAKAVPSKAPTVPSKAPTVMDFSTQELRMVRFGKHKGTSYELMMNEQKAYCEWVINTYEIEDKSSDPTLIHFAVYLLQQGFNGRVPTTKLDQEYEKEEKEMDAEWDQEL